MLNFLRKDQRVSHHIDLVSVHIPKTAGTSFRDTLKQIYGEERVIRLDIPLRNPKLRINQQPWSATTLPSKAKVVHGHFSPELFTRYFRPPAEDALFITWLRDPVDRVISNYYYLEKRLKEILNEENRGVNILSKMQRTLLEYAADPLNQNRMARFLRGRNLADFAFVGILEHYDEDLEQLARQLSWAETPRYHHNITGSRRSVSPALRERIAAFNQEDLALYEAALSLRRERTPEQ